MERTLWLLSRVSQIAGIVAILVTAVLSILSISIPPQVILSMIGIPFLIHIMVVSTRVEDIVRNRPKDVDSLRAHIKAIDHHLCILSDILQQKKTKQHSEKIDIRMLHTPYDFYRALNTARTESVKTIRVMKLHHLGPQDAEHDLKVTEASGEYSKSQTHEEMERWYKGLADWNSREGRLVERVSTRPNDSMTKFIDEAKYLMAGTAFIAHELPWDGELPLLNLCIFDDCQIVITFSTKPWENPYKPIPGLWIKNYDVARFFSQRYYDRMVEYCRSRPPVRSEESNHQ